MVKKHIGMSPGLIKELKKEKLKAALGLLERG